MDIKDLEDEASRIRWYHSIPLGHGMITPGYDHSSRRLPRLGLPDDLTGKSVLDIGAWDGFFSFEAERRGASRVLATDSFVWRSPEWGRAGFDFARRVLHSRVEDKEIDVLDLSPEAVGGPFDLVLFLGVLYHLQNPLLALERVFSVTGYQLILGTRVDMLYHRRPAMAFYPGDELSHDPTNWWGPNPAAVEGMLRAVGFREVTVVRSPYSLPLPAPRAMKWKLRRRDQFNRGICQGEMICHSFR